MAMKHIPKRRGRCTRCGLAINQSFSCERNVWTAEDGRRIAPIPWGNETGQWEDAVHEYTTCPECGVYPGAFHHAGCTIEQIPDGVDGVKPEPSSTPAEPGLMPKERNGCLLNGLFALGYGWSWLTASRRRVVFLAVVLFIIASRACIYG